MVRGFLQALGVAPERIPASLDERTALYRSVLAGWRGRAAFGPAGTRSCRRRTCRGGRADQGVRPAAAGRGALLVFAAGAATAGLQAALGLPGTLIAIVGMVVFGSPTAGTSIATPLLASPWDVLGQLLPPGAALSLARNIVYHLDTDINRPLTVLTAYALAGALIMAGTALVRQRKAVARAAVPATAA